MSEDDILQCECGCTSFHVARDGLIECADCGHPNANHLAVKADVDASLAARGVRVIGEQHERRH